jgi:uncharacterized protein involved in outer membrane biogenesis
MKTRRLLWLLPLAALLVLAAIIISLPGLVASGAHRGAIEALASSLTGRDVHIGGKLSLAFFPEPQLIAERITISGPDRETITAQSLTLDIALDTLLHGRLTARSLTLQSPVIAFPWPLPGGAAAVAPPLWLAALHAQISDGQISIGNVMFQHVNADLFTGTGGAVSISGTGTLLAQPVSISLGLGGIGATGAAPLSIDGQDGDATMHLSGVFSAASTLTGTVSFNAPGAAASDPAYSQPISATANISANPGEIQFSNLHMTQGNGMISGTARLDIATARLNLALTASNLTLPKSLPGGSIPAGLQTLSIHVTLDAVEPVFAGVLLPHLWAEADISAAGLNLESLQADLPGNGGAKCSGTLDAEGNLQGKASFSSQDLAAFAAALGATYAPPAAWRRGNISATFSGTEKNLSLTGITGTLGTANLTGTAVINLTGATPEIYGALHFDELDFPAGAAWQLPPNFGLAGGSLKGGAEITASRASLYGVKMTRLLIDADFGPALNIRRFSASVDQGFAAGSLSLAPDGRIAAARALLSLPSAAPLTALLPTRWQPPAGRAAPAGLAALANAKLAAFLLAAGPPSQLATSLNFSLGDINAFIAPVLDLTKLTAAGPLLLRMPSAISLFKTLGLNAGLAWPGAGSVSLRADLSASSQQISLPDFILSMGDLTASGHFQVTPDLTLAGNIDADTLALPPWPTDFSPLWAALAATKGKISVTANRVLLNGNQIFGRGEASIALQQGGGVFTLNKASLGSGILSGNISATLSPTAPPALAGKFTLENADVSSITPAAAFPLTLPSGILSASGVLTASGYTAQAWAATLSGAAGFSAANGVITGFDLAALAGALTPSPREAALSTACLTGNTPFATLTLAGNFSNGIYQISTATLQGPAGAASATGSIDVPDEAVALDLTFMPNVTKPPKLGLAMIGNWANPKKIPAIKPALDWLPIN